jgi:F-type H+-transporting ATPase subunit delta
VRLAVLHRTARYVSKPAISRGRGGIPAASISKSRLKPKGLRRPFTPVAGLAENSKATRAASAKQQASLENTLGLGKHLAGEEHPVSGMAGRYATALFELAREMNALDAVKADLDRFDALVAESPDLARLVRSPVFSADEQLQALTAVLDRADIGDIAAKFLKLVTRKRRLFAVRDIIRGYRRLVAEHKGEALAEITVAEQLKDDHVAALKNALKAVSGKDVDLAIKIDPAIIGGLVVKLGSRMVDTSLRTKLNAIRHAMKEAR